MEAKAAVVFERAGEFKIENVELSEPRDDEVMVRNRRYGHLSH